MNERLGRIGAQESTALITTALTVGGAFSKKSADAYSMGNAEYIVMPLSILLSLAVYFILAGAIKRCGAKNFCELVSGIFMPLGCLAAIGVMLLMIYAAFNSLSSFTAALHSLFFEGVGYDRIALFIVPTVFLIAMLGFETMSRTAKLYAIPMVLMLLVSIAGSASEFRVYRLYPLFGGGAGGIIIKAVERIPLFFPAFMSLLIVADGVNGIDHANRTAAISAVLAAGILIIAHLAIGLVYTYKELDRLFMPLFRINYLSKFEAHLMRMDKFAHLIWMNGGMISAALYIYCASRIFIREYALLDIRPAIAVSSLLTLILLLAETGDGTQSAFKICSAFMNKWGFSLYILPPILVSIFALARPKRRKIYGK
ncbi:MAG: GerAB/ArcD/ProY family transporter [Clostridia bacterium]|nr:GerAB/ArcD/ProY family transporter [Clostridia bacterium]